MKNLQKNKLTKTVLCGIIAGLETVILALSSVFTAIDLTLAAITVFFTLFLLWEYGKGSALGVYIAVSVLSLVLLGNKFTAVCYLFMFGPYPILKAVFERAKGGFLPWLIKIAYLALSFTAVYAISAALLFLEETAPVFSPYFFATGAVAVLAFVLFDIAMTMLERLYFVKLRKKLGINRLIKK